MIGKLSVLVAVLAGVAVAGFDAAPAQAAGICDRPDPPPSCEPAGYVIAGSLASAVRSPSGVTVSGTATEEGGAPLRVDITIGGTVSGSLTPDSSGLFQGDIPARVGAGVCARAVVVGTTVAKPLGCVNLAIGFDPVGALDELTFVGGQVAYSGWALDPDTYAAIDVVITHDGAPATRLANASRPGVGTTYPGYGDNHAFTGTFTSLGGGGLHTICAKAVNVGAGADTDLGCRTYQTPVGAPSNVTVTDRRSDSIRLAWDDTSISEDGFRIEQLLDDGTWLWVWSAPIDATEGYANFLAADTTYCFRVVAYNAHSESASDQVCARTKKPMLPNVTDLRATDVTQDSITLAWSDNAVGEEVYLVVIRNANVGLQLVQRHEGTGPMTTVIGPPIYQLTMYTEYQIWVIPIHTEHDTYWSDDPMITVRTAGADPG
jgi:hypothetical protein